MSLTALLKKEIVDGQNNAQALLTLPRDAEPKNSAWHDSEGEMSTSKASKQDIDAVLRFSTDSKVSASISGANTDRSKFNQTKQKLNTLVNTMTDLVSLLGESTEEGGDILSDADENMAEDLLNLLEQSDKLRKILYPPHPALRKSQKMSSK